MGFIVSRSFEQGVRRTQIHSVNHTVRIEEAAPTPHILIRRFCRVRFGISTVRVLETRTYSQPIGNSRLDVCRNIVTVQFIGICCKHALFLVVTERQVVGSASARTVDIDIVTLRRSPVTVVDAYHIPVCIEQCLSCCRVKIVVAHITETLVRPQVAVLIVLLIAVLLLPQFSKVNQSLAVEVGARSGNWLVEIHTEQFRVGSTCIAVNLHHSLQLARHIRIIRKD